MAAAYLFHIVQNHPFVDGNKRTGLVAALVFLDLNGIEIEAPKGSLHDLTMSVAMGRAGKPEAATLPQPEALISALTAAKASAGVKNLPAGRQAPRRRLGCCWTGRRSRWRNSAGGDKDDDHGLSAAANSIQ